MPSEEAKHGKKKHRHICPTFWAHFTPWRLLLFEDLNDQTNDADDHQAILKQIAVSYHGITPSEKRRGKLKFLPPRGGTTVSSGQTLLKTQNEYSINRHDPQQKRNSPPLTRARSLGYTMSRRSDRTNGLPRRFMELVHSDRQDCPLTVTSF